MGLAFKENCPDLRNTRVIDVVSELSEYGCTIDVFDPWINSDDANKTYALKLINEPEKKLYDGILIAVGHQKFINMGSKEIRSLGKPKHLLYDLKYIFPTEETDLRL